MTVKKDEAFTRAEAALLNERLHILKNTAALNQFGKMRAALGQLARVKMAPKIASVLFREHGPGTIRPSPRRPVAV